MSGLHQGLCLVCHLLADEVNPVQEMRFWRAEGRVVIAGIHKVFRAQRIALFFFKRLQGGHGNRGRIAEPVYVLLAGIFTEDQGEVVEEGGEANHVYFGVFIQPFLQGLLHELPGLGVGRIVSLVLLAGGIACPVVGQVVVDLGRIPNLPGQEVYRVFVEQFGAGNGDDCRGRFCVFWTGVSRFRFPINWAGGGRRYAPPAGRHFPAGGTVYDLPVLSQVAL